ncbi:hypothetical protein BGZ65_002182, partial [Modicella reniformis]
MDAGIIRAFKALYRRKWVDWKLTEIEQQRFTSTLDIYSGVFMIRSAWDQVKQSTFVNCWSAINQHEIQEREDTEAIHELLKQAFKDQSFTTEEVIDFIMDPEEQVDTTHAVPTDEKLILRVCGPKDVRQVPSSDENDEVIMVGRALLSLLAVTAVAIQTCTAELAQGTYNIRLSPSSHDRYIMRVGEDSLIVKTPDSNDPTETGKLWEVTIDSEDFNTIKPEGSDLFVGIADSPYHSGSPVVLDAQSFRWKVESLPNSEYLRRYIITTIKNDY